MNIVEYALKFKDLASGDLKKFGAQSRQTFTQAQTFTNNLTGRNKVLGQSYNELQKRVRQVEDTVRNSTIPSQIRAARKELNLLQREARSHPGFTGGFVNGSSKRKGGGLLGALGLGKFVAPLMIAGGIMGGIQFAGNSINAGLQRQQQQVSFEVLAGDKKAGQTLTKQLVDLQKDTILGPEVFKNAQTMMGFGFKSTEVIDNLKMLGDISMGDAQRLESITLAFSQIRAAGRLTGQDLLQLVNAGFNPLEQMSRTTGKSLATLRDEMSRGLISFGQVQKAFKDATSEGGKFHNMLETIAKTPAGMKAQIEGAWNEIKVGVGEAFMPLTAMALKFAQSILPIAENMITPLSNGIQKAVEWMQNLKNESSGLMSYVETIKNLWQFGISPVIQKVFGLVFNMVNKLTQFVAKSELLKDIFKFVGIIVSNIFNMVEMLVDALSWVFNKIVMPILNAIETAYRWITGNKNLKISQQTSTYQKKQDQTNNDLLSSIVSNTSKNNESADAAAESVTSGGPKIINVTVQKFLDAININTTYLEESESEIESRMLELFGRVLIQGAASQ